MAPQRRTQSLTMQYGCQLNSRELSRCLAAFAAAYARRNRPQARRCCPQYFVNGDKMADIVNLNKFRKRKAKDARLKQAETNRRLHGRTKAERAHDALQKKKLETVIEHARLEPPTDTEDENTP